MPTDSPQSIYVEYTPEFKRSLRKLARKYRTIRTDVKPVIKQLQTGDLIGDQITGTRGYTLFKSRVKNSDIQKGKRSGYRLIYWLRTSKDIILVTIYSKLDQGDISTKEIRRIKNNFRICEKLPETCTQFPFYSNPKSYLSLCSATQAPLHYTNKP